MSIGFRYLMGFDWYAAAGVTYDGLREYFGDVSRDSGASVACVEREFWRSMDEVHDREGVQALATGQVVYDPDYKTEEDVRDMGFWNDVLRHALQDLPNRLPR